MAHKPASGWDDIATWYDGWVGEAGSHFHQHIAIPAILTLLALQPKQHVLDIGAGNRQSSITARMVISYRAMRGRLSGWLVRANLMPVPIC
jgi:hypothetical protein